MGKLTGYIMLHRRLLDNPIVCKDADHLAVWVWLLLKAAWVESDTTFSGERITLQPGQLPPISRKTISSELQISESKVQRILKSFENEHQIEQQMGNHSRLISICSWDRYQYREQQSEPQVNSKRTTSEQQVNTIKEYKNNNNHNKEIGIQPKSFYDIPEDQAWTVEEKMAALRERRKRGV